MTGPQQSRRDGPDFLCIGLQKAGTRWLYDQLQFHPGFWMPPVKELHFFDGKFPSKAMCAFLAEYDVDPVALNARRVAERHRSLDTRDAQFLEHVRDLRPAYRCDVALYASLFAPKGNALSGDITPDYSTLNGELIAQLATAFPATRIVLLLRDPVERCWSQLCMAVERGKAAPGAMQHPENLERWLKGTRSRVRSFPTDIAARWRSRFGDRVGVFFFDDIVASPGPTLQAILHHIGVDERHTEGCTLPVDFNRKAGPKAPPPPPLMALLEAHFRDERRRCAEMFGGPALTWVRGGASA